jgi:hypothetical protein
VPVAGNAAIDEAWIDLLERREIEPESPHHTGTKILHQNVRLGRETFEEILSRFALDIDLDTPFAAAPPER